MRLKFNKKYLCAFIIIFIIETIIAIYINDNFIRPYIGDALVVVLIYCFVNTFAPKRISLLSLYIFIFAVLVEIGQYFNLAESLGINNKVVKIIIGSTFDMKDIACYLAGCVGLFLFETITEKITNSRI